MDQEKFDTHLMDYLFDELDEVTRAAMKRKIEADAQCREIEARLRATIEVGQLPVEQPSDDLEARILEACDQAQKGEPLRAKITRILSWAGSKAMDPRLAMAAILMLVIGSAILLLPAKPGSVAVSPDPDKAPAGPDVSPLDKGENADEAEPAPTPAAVASAAASSDKRTDDDKLAQRFKAGQKNMDAGKFGDAQRDFNAVSSVRGHPRAPEAALEEARAARRQSCKSAIPIYERVRKDFPKVANDAAWEQADCYAELGNSADARKLWASLESDPAYRDRARNELASQGQAGTSGKNAVAAPKRAAAPPSGGSAPRAKAAPAESYQDEKSGY
ncbi:MAG TPA: zf-HC2 domain-containing protein [Polyangiaceae bacterium]|nr:zf-HC2 domain-containing protein [Polyangiaceae bacterium]